MIEYWKVIKGFLINLLFAGNWRINRIRCCQCLWREASCSRCTEYSVKSVDTQRLIYWNTTRNVNASFFVCPKIFTWNCGLLSHWSIGFKVFRAVSTLTVYLLFCSHYSILITVVIETDVREKQNRKCRTVRVSERTRSYLPRRRTMRSQAQSYCPKQNAHQAWYSRAVK